jgi:hypothetical protein
MHHPRCVLYKFRGGRYVKTQLSLHLFSFPSLYIFVTCWWATVAETCRQPNKTDTKTDMFWRTYPLPICYQVNFTILQKLTTDHLFKRKSLLHKTLIIFLCVQRVDILAFLTGFYPLHILKTISLRFHFILCPHIPTISIKNWGSHIKI